MKSTQNLIKLVYAQTINQYYYERKKQKTNKALRVSNMLSTSGGKKILCMTPTFLSGRNSPETLQDFSGTLENERPSGTSPKLANKVTPFGILKLQQRNHFSTRISWYWACMTYDFRWIALNIINFVCVEVVVLCIWVAVDEPYAGLRMWLLIIICFTRST